MADEYRSRLMDVISEQQEALTDIFALAVREAQIYLLEIASNDGTVALSRQESAENRLLAVFSAVFMSSSMLPFAVNGNRVIPNSPLAAVAWNGVVRATDIAVQQQRQIMRDGLGNYPDVAAALTRANRDPRPYIANYATPYSLVRNNGRRLVDSIAFAAVETRRKLRLFIRALFGERRNVREIIDLMRPYFTPGRKIERSLPGGQSGASDALRIARSEPILAYSLTARNLAQLNPYIRQVYVRRSHSAAPPCIICDEKVRGSPYTTSDFPVPGYHPDCLCQLVFITGSRRAATERLQGSELMNVRGPLHPDILSLLIGAS